MNGNVFPGMLSLGEAIRAQNKKSGVPMTMRGSDQVFKSLKKFIFTENKNYYLNLPTKYSHRSIFLTS